MYYNIEHKHKIITVEMRQSWLNCFVFTNIFAHNVSQIMLTKITEVEFGLIYVVNLILHERSTITYTAT